MLNSSVRDALEKSVTACPVSLNVSQASIVPKLALTSRRARGEAVNVRQHPLDLRAGEVGIDHEAGPRADRGLRGPRSRSSSQRADVLRSCQTIARCSGSPVPDVPGDDGLALVRDPDARHVGGPDPRCVQRLSRDLRGRHPRSRPHRARPNRAAENAARTRGRRGRPAAHPDRRRGRSCRWSPGRSPVSRPGNIYGEADAMCIHG